MFEVITNEKRTAGARGLKGTAQLVGISNAIAQENINKITAAPETYEEIFENSKIDHNYMDILINELTDLSAVVVPILDELEEDNLEKMLRSQQSKRSRTKSMPMTLDNYRAMMSAGVAELLLRRALGRPKMSSSLRRTPGCLTYTDEELAMYADDQELLRRELRNVQSKKSITKSKEDFSEESKRWVDLLEAERQLKSIRTALPRRVGSNRVDKTKEQLKEMLGDKAVTDLKAAEARDLISKLLEEISE